MATGPTDTCMPTIRITATTGIGITKQIAAESDYLTTRCERSRLHLQSFSALSLRWHPQHPPRPNIVARRRPIRRLITRPPVEPAVVSRTALRVYRLTRLAGHDRMTGDARQGTADRGEYRQAAGANSKAARSVGIAPLKPRRRMRPGRWSVLGIDVARAADSAHRV